MRNPEITKFCPNCGARIERKYFGLRIEDYAAYRKRIYCDVDCYRGRPKQIAEDIIENKTPLQFMLIQMNTTTNSLAYRKEMAALAAPYCHPKLAPVKPGKKEKEKISSRFAPRPAPNCSNQVN